MKNELNFARNTDLETLKKALSDKFGAEVFTKAKERARFRLDLAQAVKQRRIEMHMDQKVLAKKLRTTQQQLSRYEVGENSPTVDRFYEICDSLNLEMIIRDKESGRELIRT